MQPMLEETIPLDLGACLAGEKDADHALAEQLRWASGAVGFYFIGHHGVGQALIDRTFAECHSRFVKINYRRQDGQAA